MARRSGRYQAEKLHEALARARFSGTVTWATVPPVPSVAIACPEGEVTRGPPPWAFRPLADESRHWPGASASKV